MNFLPSIKLVGLIAISSSVLLSTSAKAGSSVSSTTNLSSLSNGVEPDLRTAFPRHGLIDLKGRQILPEQYFSITDQGDGTLALGSFDYKNPKLSPRNMELWRVDDRESIPTKVPNDLRVTRILNGFFVVQKANEDHGKFGLFDKSGRKVLDTAFSSIDYVGKDFTVVSNNAIYDFSGNKIADFPKGASLPKRFFGNEDEDRDDQCLLDGHRIPIVTMTCEHLKPKPPAWLKAPFNHFGYLDEKGELVVSGFFFKSSGFSEGLALVNLGRVPAFIDITGNKSFDLEFGSATSFRDGVSVVTLNDGKVGVIDKTGKFKVRATYGHVHSIGHGLFAAKSDTPGGGSWEIVDITGKVVLKLPLGTTWVSSEGEGLVPYVVGGVVTPDTGYIKPNSGAKWGFIDLKTGKTVIKPSFAFAKSFSFGVAPVAMECLTSGPVRMGLIDSHGKWVVQPKYSDLTILSGGTVVTSIKPKNNFSTVDWNSKTKTGLMNRKRDFDALVSDHHLIGMKRSEFFSLVEMPGFSDDDPKHDARYYVLTSTGCINEREGVEFEFASDRVKRWRYVSGWQGPTFGPWVE